LLIWIKRFLT